MMMMMKILTEMKNRCALVVISFYWDRNIHRHIFIYTRSSKYD